MIVEQVMNCKSREEAQDSLAGWRQMPTFMMAYIRDSERPGVGPTLVGAFQAANGKLGPGQRRIRTVEFRLGGWQRES